MAKKSKNPPQDDQRHDDQFFEIPEDRIEQIENTEPDGKQERPQRKESGQGDTGQTRDPKDALRTVAEQADVPREDLLADVRRSLLAEEDVVDEPKGLFGRIKNRFKKAAEPKAEEVETQVQNEVEIVPQEDLRELIPEPKQKKKRSSKIRAEEKAIQEFFSDLEALADVTLEGNSPVISEVQETPTEEAKTIEKAKKIPKLPVKTVAEDEVDFDAVREMALQEYDETKIEPEERKQPLQEEVRRTIRELKPFERFLLIAAGILTVGILLASGTYLIVASISIPTPAPTATVDLGNIVHPTRLSLPGGWAFDLGEGQVSNGEWTPQGAEWLVGTEISRWVALPWSLQLEAVLRTLKPGDQIEMQMSNLDVLTFNVYSIQQMTMGELLSSDAKKPSLLVVLYNDEKADGTFWTVTALP